MENNVDTIIKKADSNNSFSKPCKRVFELTIRFSSFLELSTFFKFIYYLKLDSSITFESPIGKVGDYDVIITNKDNINYDSVRELIKSLLENNIRVH